MCRKAKIGKLNMIERREDFEVNNVQTVLLVIALSLDVFLACVACGTEKIQIKNASAFTISGICSGVLLLSLLAGSFLEGVIKETYTEILCFLGLFLVGLFKLIEYVIKRYIKKHKFLCKRVKITFSQLNFILSIYNNPVMADRDHSSVMSVSEAVFFALAMSMDGLVGGLSAGLLNINVPFTILCNFLVGFLAVKAGSAIGMQAALKRETDISWLGGALFVALAFSKVLW